MGEVGIWAERRTFLIDRPRTKSSVFFHYHKYHFLTLTIVKLYYHLNCMGRFLLCFTNVFDFDLRVCVWGGEGDDAAVCVGV